MASGIYLQPCYLKSVSTKIMQTERTLTTATQRDQRTPSKACQLSRSAAKYTYAIEQRDQHLATWKQRAAYNPTCREPKLVTHQTGAQGESTGKSCRIYTPFRLQWVATIGAQLMAGYNSILLLQYTMGWWEGKNSFKHWMHVDMT